jgi:hypothetical protein
VTSELLYKNRTEGILLGKQKESADKVADVKASTFKEI